MNADSVPGGRQPSTKPNDLDCESTCKLLPSTFAIVVYYYYSTQVPIHLPFCEGWKAELPSTAVRACSPCHRLYITVAVVLNINYSQYLLHCKFMSPLDHWGWMIMSYHHRSVINVSAAVLEKILKFLFDFKIASIFTRDSIYAIARICLGNSVCLSVRPSVCPSHGWISQKRLKLGSRNFHHTVAPSL